MDYVEVVKIFLMFAGLLFCLVSVLMFVFLIRVGLLQAFGGWVHKYKTIWKYRDVYGGILESYKKKNVEKTKR